MTTTTLEKKKLFEMAGRSCFPPSSFARALYKLNTCFARASYVRTHL